VPQRLASSALAAWTDMIPDAAPSSTRRARLAFGALGLLPLFEPTCHCALMRPGVIAPTSLSPLLPCELVTQRQTFVRCCQIWTLVPETHPGKQPCFIQVQCIRDRWLRTSTPPCVPDHKSGLRAGTGLAGREVRERRARPARCRKGDVVGV